jgi:hypothetical protein
MTANVVFNTKLRAILADFQVPFRDFVDEKEYIAAIDAIDKKPDTPKFVRLFNQHAANKATEDAVFKCDPAILKSCALFKMFDLKRVHKRMANKDELWSRLCDLYRAVSMQNMMNDKMQAVLQTMAPAFSKSGLSAEDVRRDPNKLMDVVVEAMKAPGGTDMMVDMMTSNSGPVMECVGKMFRKPGQEISPVDEIAERCNIKLEDIGEHSDQLKEMLANPLVSNNLRDIMSTFSINNTGKGDNLSCDIDTNGIMSKVEALNASAATEAAKEALEQKMRDDTVAQTLLDLEQSEEAVKAFKTKQ